MRLMINLNIVSLFTDTVEGLINVIKNIGGQEVPVLSISGWIRWMTRIISVTYNWDLTWAFYKSGFGSVGESNYWLGLERVHQLTSSSKYRLRIEMKLDSTEEWRSVEYWSFSIGDEATTKYQLNVDGYVVELFI
jgi:Fibrinogen beta and gamma chains, C-terminal globular domain